MKIFKGISLMVLTLSFIACHQEYDSDVELNKNVQRFKDDKRLKALYDSARSLVNADLPAPERSSFSDIDRFIKLRDDIINDYGGVKNVYQYLDHIKINTVMPLPDDQKCCKLNNQGTPDDPKDDTVDWSCCDFWETVRATIGTVGCDKVYGNYYECVQQSVCNTCGTKND